MALSNTQLYNIFNSATTCPHALLKENNIEIRHAKEVKDKVHAKGFYFGDESILNIKTPNIDPFHVYVISPDNESRRDDYSLVIFPFVINKIMALVDTLEGITIGDIQLNSNFNAFKIHNRSNSNKYSGVGYSVKATDEESVWRLIIEIKKSLNLPANAPKRLSKFFQTGLPKTKKENINPLLTDYLASINKLNLS